MALIPFINKELNAPVWRMEIDETTDTLFLETRNTEEKKVAFTGINLNNGKINFNKLTLPERWLNGIEAAGNGILLIHGFLNEGVPVHKGLTAIESTSGTILWVNYNLNFERLTTAGIIAFDARMQPKKLFLADALNGKVIDTIEPDNERHLKSAIVYPQLLTANNNLIAGLMPGAYGNEVHYLTLNNFRVVSLHMLKENSLTQHLYIFDAQNQLVFEDIIAGQIQKLQPEAFISYKNKLIWLKNRSAINVLNL